MTQIKIKRLTEDRIAAETNRNNLLEVEGFSEKVASHRIHCKNLSFEDLDMIRNAIANKKEEILNLQFGNFLVVDTEESQDSEIDPQTPQNLEEITPPKSQQKEEKKPESKLP